ncbi:MAG: triose-phosphate isomerase [Rhizobiales bacterium]|nr:triose-phosphate isomerase [Hyphomicrobiales bacterium]
MASATPRPIVAGNWKMNGTSISLKEIRLLTGMLKGVRLKCDVMVCPPATLLSRVQGLTRSSRIRLGGQDCHDKVSGAHTGDVSADMLSDAGATAVIVGHSERRADHGETDAVVAAKAAAAHKSDLTAIVCIGETLAQRKAGETLRIIGAQLKKSLPASSTATNTVIAYEPVWAIGTGLTPTPAEIRAVHRHIRKGLLRIIGPKAGMRVPVLYGGSVKPGNAEELMAVEDVNGALVGGASLKAADFIGIIKAYT